MRCLWEGNTPFLWARPSSASSSSPSEAARRAGRRQWGPRAPALLGAGRTSAAGPGAQASDAPRRSGPAVLPGGLALTCATEIRNASPFLTHDTGRLHQLPPTPPPEAGEPDAGAPKIRSPQISCVRTAVHMTASQAARPQEAITTPVHGRRSPPTLMIVPRVQRAPTATQMAAAPATHAASTNRPHRE